MQILTNILWIIAIVLLIVNALYFSIKLKFPQLKLKNMFTSVFSKKHEDGITVKDTLIMSLGSKIGVGSLAGISFAIFYGGIGTIFWIWITSFLFSINSYLENYLSIIYKEKDGLYYKSGPSYYIKNGLNNKKLSIIYAIFLTISYIIGFLTIQTNTVTVLITDMYYFNKYIVGALIAIISGYFIFKGLKSISNLCNKIIPFMSIIYFIIGIMVIILNLEKLSSLLNNIFTEAFNYKALGGGVLSTFFIGTQKSIFSSESGIGTGAIISGSSSNNNPKRQGYVGVFSTYFINLFITTITALIIGFTNYNNIKITTLNGIELTKYSFSYHLGYFGEIMLLIMVILFAISTIVTGYYYGESSMKIIVSNKIYLFLLKIVTIIVLFIGAISSSFYIWKIIDIFVAILSIINIYAIFKLRDKVI